MLRIACRDTQHLPSSETLNQTSIFPVTIFNTEAVEPSFLSAEWFHIAEVASVISVVCISYVPLVKASPISMTEGRWLVDKEVLAARSGCFTDTHQI